MSVKVTCEFCNKQICNKYFLIKHQNESCKQSEQYKIKQEQKKNQQDAQACLIAQLQEQLKQKDSIILALQQQLLEANKQTMIQNHQQRQQQMVEQQQQIVHEKIIQQEQYTIDQQNFKLIYQALLFKVILNRRKNFNDQLALIRSQLNEKTIEINYKKILNFIKENENRIKFNDHYLENLKLQNCQQLKEKREQKNEIKYDIPEQIKDFVQIKDYDQYITDKYNDDINKKKIKIKQNIYIKYIIILLFTGIRHNEVNTVEFQQMDKDNCPNKFMFKNLSKGTKDHEGFILNYDTVLKYLQEIQQLIKDGILKTSTGTFRENLSNTLKQDFGVQLISDLRNINSQLILPLFKEQNQDQLNLMIKQQQYGHSDINITKNHYDNFC